MVCAGTLTNIPLVYIIPSDILAAEPTIDPTSVEPAIEKTLNWLFEPAEVYPPRPFESWVTSSNISPSWNSV